MPRPSWFFLASGRLLQPVCDASAREVVRRQLDADPVAGQDADEVHPQLAADVSQDAVLVLQLNGEHRVRQRLDDRSFYFDRVLLGHRRRQTPSYVSMVHGWLSEPAGTVRRAR